MPKASITWADGWPTMTPLARREAVLLAAELGEGERVLGQVLGEFGQAAVATERRVLVVKAGIRAGLLFGGRATSLDYAQIRRVELRVRIAQGELELHHDADAGARLSALGTSLPANEVPTALLFGKLDLPGFTAFADRVRERAAAGRAPTG